MGVKWNEKKKNQRVEDKDSLYESKNKYFVDIDRMQNEGLSGGYVTKDETGVIKDTTTDTFDFEDKFK